MREIIWENYWLYERNWFTLAYLGPRFFSKNKPSLEIFLVLSDEKMYPIHKKSSKPVKNSLLLLSLEDGFLIPCFWMYDISLCSFCAALAPNHFYYLIISCTFMNPLWLVFGLLRSTGAITSSPMWINLGFYHSKFYL